MDRLVSMSSISARLRPFAIFGQKVENWRTSCLSPITFSALANRFSNAARSKCLMSSAASPLSRKVDCASSKNG